MLLTPRAWGGGAGFVGGASPKERHMTDRQLSRVNQILSIFGNFGPSQRVRWFKTNDPQMRYFIPRGRDTRVVSSTGIAIVETKFEKFSWANILGPGWIVATYKDPIPVSEFTDRFGENAPPEANGGYQPIENTKREPNDPPTEKNTYLLRQLLLRMFEMGASLTGERKDADTQQICPICSDDLEPLDAYCGYCGQEVTEVVFKGDKILESLVAGHAKRHADEAAMVSDQVDNDWPAFNNLNSGKRGGHVSFGGI